MKAGAAGDRVLVGRASAGDRAAADRLLPRLAQAIWPACRLLNAEAEARAVFLSTLAALQADNFAGLGAYDGRCRLEIFVALRVRDLMAQRLLCLLGDDPPAAWSAFQYFFAADIERLIRRRLPGPHHGDLRRDAYQDLCLALIDDDYRRIKAYSGTGSFGGFLLQAVDRLLIDFLRRLGSRRCLPAQLLSLSDVGEVAAPGLIEPSPEDVALEHETDRLLALAAAVVREAATGLPEPEQLYLRVALGGARPLPAREVARLMQRPVDDIYALKRRVLRRLRDALQDEKTVKKWLASV